MTVTAKCLVEGTIASNAQTTYYTATGVRTILDKLTGYNYTAGAVTLAVNLVASGGAAGAANLVVLKTLSAGETYTFPEIVGHVLNAGDFVSTIAGAATSVVIRLSGREVS
jgi:arginine repressor